MNPATGADLCRITVVGPRRRIDVSLPADVPFAELFPTILRYAGENLADAGLAHGGWVLQRLDEAPLDPSATPTQTNMRDGEMIYLRPGMSQLPELAFDDVADVVATGVNDKPDRWRPELTRRFALAAATGALLVGAVVLALSGPSWIAPAILAGMITLLLLIGGVTLSRAVGDSAAGAVLGYVALPYAFLTGVLGLSVRGEIPLGDIGSEQLLVGFGAVVLVAAIAAAAIADGLPAFLGVGVAAFLGTIGTAVAFAFDSVEAAGVGGVTLAVAMAFTPLIPTLAFRMARVTLPPVPKDADDLRRDTLMVDGKQLLRRTARADRFVTGMATAIALVGLFGQIPLAFSDGWVAPTMNGMGALALLLRSRLFRGRTQKLWFMGAGMTGFGLLAIGLALRSGQTSVLVGVVVPLVLLAALVAAMGMWLPEHRPSPFWARATDIIDVMVVISLIPFALGVLGVFSQMRGLSG